MFSLLKCGFLKKSFIMNAPLVGLLLHPPKSDDWEWATDKRCIHNKLLRNPHFSTFIGNPKTTGAYNCKFVAQLIKLKLSVHVK